MDKGVHLVALVVLLMSSSCNLLDKNDRSDSRVLNSAAFKNLTDSIKQFPRDASLYLRRGQLLLQKKYPDLAVQDYEKAWKISPDEQTALLYTASLFMAGK